MGTDVPVSHKRIGRTKRKTNVFRSLLKNLHYDGTGTWLTFKRKFDRYAVASEWTEEECLNALSWSLSGNAADFHAIITEHDDLTYRQVIQRLDQRFGVTELAATAEARFQQSNQSQGETLEDWADLVMTLASKAFRDLPDNEVGQHVGVQGPTSMEEAIYNVRWFEHVHHALYGKSKPRKQTREEDGPSVLAVGEETPSSSNNGQASTGLSGIEATLTKLRKASPR